MGEHQGIEDVLRQEVVRPKVRNLQPVAQGLADALAAADLPLVDRERGIAVIRLTFDGMADALNAWLDSYPPDIFDGSSGDAGPVLVAAIHKALAEFRAARIIGGESE